MAAAPKAGTLAVLVLSLLQIACGKTYQGDTLYHPNVTTAYVRTYHVDTASSDQPQATGVEFSADMLANVASLPCTPMPGGPNFMRCARPFSMKFPTVPGMPFMWMKLGWEKTGHMPQGVYSVPHWDVHFWFDTQQYWEQSVFTPANAGPCLGASVELHSQLNKPMPKQCFPTDYANLDAVVFGEGNHLINTKAPEISGGKNFTETFIYGMHDGQITYLEPMVTQSYLLALEQGEHCMPIPGIPSEYAKGGWRPTTYCINKKADGSVVVELRNFKKYTDACKVGPDTVLVGYLPPDMAPTDCPVPAPGVVAAPGPAPGPMSGMAPMGSTGRKLK